MIINTIRQQECSCYWTEQAPSLGLIISSCNTSVLCLASFLIKTLVWSIVFKVINLFTYLLGPFYDLKVRELFILLTKELLH